MHNSRTMPSDDNSSPPSSAYLPRSNHCPQHPADPASNFSRAREQLTRHRLSLRKQVRSGTSTNSFMMVDSPGMIDSPMSRSIYERSDPDSPAGRGKGADTSRGYDFEGVVRWFAERADVILLFFDPDKPGTTGETLSILTNSLAGKDHKLYVVLNKVGALLFVCPCLFFLYRLLFLRLYSGSIEGGRFW